MTDTIARTIAALREFPVAVAAELYRLAPGRKPPNGDDILVLCDAAEASLRATNEIERAYQILEVNGVPRGRARNIANGIDVLVTRMERGLRYPPREPTHEMISCGVIVMSVTGGTLYDDVCAMWRAMWDAAPKINEGGQDVDKSVHADGSSPSVPVPPSPDAVSHAWKSGYAQAKEEDVLSRRFCPHCNPCDGAGNEECRKPVPPSPDADLVARATAYLTGGGLFNPELANHDAVRDLIIDCRDALKRLTRERDEALAECARPGGGTGEPSGR